MWEFVNSTAKLVLTHGDNSKGFVHLIPIVPFPEPSSE